jgi:hypothetical protein
MFYEKLDFKVDVEKLKEDVINHVFTLGEQAEQGKEFNIKQYQGFGGWSLLTRTGDWQDGWELGHVAQDEASKFLFKNGKVNYALLKYLNLTHSLEHKNPTQACVGEIKKVLEQIESLGLYPRRARVTCLQAHSKTSIHKDGDGEYMARIHIPLITNKKCVHLCEGQNLHMPADGSVYMMWVNNWHQIRNDSDENRYHIIMDAYDVKKITKNFKYEGDINLLEEYAKTMRTRIDEAVITPEEQLLFDNELKKYITESKNYV